jgi:hypothetical protein
MPLFPELYDGLPYLFVINAFAMKHQQQPARAGVALLLLLLLLLIIEVQGLVCW